MPFVLLIAANLMWGAVWVVAKLALSELTPLQVSAWRMIGAGVLALVLLWRPLRAGALPRRAWPMLTLLGFVGFVVNKWLSFVGLNLTDATHTALLMALEPLFTLALARVVLGERLGPRRLAAFVAGALGAWLLIAQGLRLPAWSAATVAGDLLFVLALALEAGYSVFGKRLLTRHSALLVTGSTIVASLVFWVPLAAGDAALHGPPRLSAAGVAAIAFLAVGCTVLGYLAWFYALERLEAGLVALTLFVQPVWGALLAVWLLGERPTAYTLAGGVLVLAGLYLALGRMPAARPAAR